MDSVPLLDIIKVIEKSAASWDPTHILTHTGKCLNVDHKRVFESTLVAVRGARTKVMCYEVLSSTEWNHGSPAFCPNTFVDVTGFEETKISAMREAYGEELRGGFHPRSLDIIRQQMRVNGSVCNVAYAERFETVKEVI
jgi:LmbE family N-acetylglucosaminyl deacetylase